MYWLILIVSGLFEAVWATALDRSQGFTKLGPSLVFLVAMVLSMGGLSYALKEIPVGTGYAVWVAVGAVATVVVAMASGAESVSLAKIIFLAMIVGGVVGLKVAS
ncbi:DMT family transporter [Rothia aerolata]|uniref:QacE family quaternary ammonium compound efflux SMR transporter n=1 Tax=Rothia aerolata TaxID=1812262 RepID=A0A917MVJ3_9MICC|nr:SMR family transporter [Rothia aerolata]GGH66742.1 QacE family quaternary ammonium compound efflux SMR transporter [Rothia aerolata]